MRQPAGSSSRQPAGSSSGCCACLHAQRSDQEPNPHANGAFPLPPQVTGSARLNLSRWRHGFEPRWDFLPRSAAPRLGSRRMRSCEEAGRFCLAVTVCAGSSETAHPNERPFLSLGASRSVADRMSAHDRRPSSGMRGAGRCSRLWRELRPSGSTSPLPTGSSTRHEPWVKQKISGLGALYGFTLTRRRR